MKTSNSPRRDNVSFRFLGGAYKEDSLLSGTVVVRDGAMVLDIPGSKDGPYLIVGSAHKNWYEGKNSAAGLRHKVDAKWAEVGGAYVGIWVESNEEFLFSFNLE